MNHQTITQKACLGLIIHCRSIPEIDKAQLFFKSKGFSSGFETELFPDFFYVTVNPANGSTASFYTDNDAINFIKGEVWAGYDRIGIRIVEYNSFFQDPLLKIDEKIKQKTLSFLKSEKAFNEDCTANVSSREMSRACYALLSEGLIGIYESRFFIQKNPVKLETKPALDIKDDNNEDNNENDCEYQMKAQ